MEYSSAFVIEDNQVKQEKPPPRVCPRCNTKNTKFCYYNNYTVSQPRYKCKDCRRHWTHGGALRNIPIGGSGRKISADHQPFLHGQESNQFVGSFGGSSSSSCGIAIGNQVGSFPEFHGDIVLPFQSFPPMDRSYFHDGWFQQDYYNVESNDLNGNHLNNQSIGNHLINQSIRSYNVVSSDHKSYINQEDQNKWNHQSFNNSMKMNHNSSTNGSRESSDTIHMNKNNWVYKSSYHLEKHGP